MSSTEFLQKIVLAETGIRPPDTLRSGKKSAKNRPPKNATITMLVSAIFNRDSNHDSGHDHSCCRAVFFVVKPPNGPAKKETLAMIVITTMMITRSTELL